MANGVFGGLERAAGAFFRVAFGVALVGVIALPACGGSDATCEGVQIRGTCEKKCNESQCIAQGMKCVSNACEQTCAQHSDCPAGKYCYSTKTDSGQAGMFCDFAPFAKNGITGQYNACKADDVCDTIRNYHCQGGVCALFGCQYNSDCAAAPGTCVKDPGGDVTKNYCQKGAPVYPADHACTKSTECDSDLGLVCADGLCAYLCDTHDDCNGIGLCQSGTDDAGQKVLVCKKGTTYDTGQFGTACPSGPNGTECDAAKGFFCFGNEGDPDAYCTKGGCQADSDCATGYTCETNGTSRVPCATACGITGQPTAANCVTAAEIGAGKEFSCGPLSLLRNYCVKRDFCTSCQSDDDCRGLPNQVCAKDKSGAKICTVICDPNVSNACPWGNASTCDTFDTDLNQPTCGHKFGSCVGTGKACEPCVDDLDCPNGACVAPSFTGEKFCLTLADKCDCTGLTVDQGVSCNGGGCPKTPGGATMLCYGGDQVVGSPLYQKCYGANVDPVPGEQQIGCWPAN